MNDLHEKFEQALTHLLQESDEQSLAIRYTRRKRRTINSFDRVREDDITETERLEAL
jgi:hypothetical protein